MAQRNTLEEASELKAKLEKVHPGAVIVIIPKVTEAQVFPGAIEAQGLQDKIIRWEDHPSGKKYPVVRVESYDILQQKTCPRCGHTWNSLAIGEDEACGECFERSRDKRTDEEIQAESARRLAESQAREDWYE